MSEFTFYDIHMYVNIMITYNVVNIYTYNVIYRAFVHIFS